MGLPASFLRREPGEPKQGNLSYFCKDWWGGNNGAVCKGQSLCNHTFCMGESHFCDRGNKRVTGRWNSSGNTSASQVKRQIATLRFACVWEGGFRTNFYIFHGLITHFLFLHNLFRKIS